MSAQSKGYAYPVDIEGNYDVEPSDEQCVTLLRALWHYVAAYEEQDATVISVVDDLLRSTSVAPFMEAHELNTIKRAFGMRVDEVTS